MSWQSALSIAGGATALGWTGTTVITQAQKGSLETKLGSLETKIEKRFNELEREQDKRFSELEKKQDRFELEMRGSMQEMRGSMQRLEMLLG